VCELRWGSRTLQRRAPAHLCMRCLRVREWQLEWDRVREWQLEWESDS
jgi:hypothetical protein